MKRERKWLVKMGSNTRDRGKGQISYTFCQYKGHGLSIGNGQMNDKEGKGDFKI